MLRNYFKIAFRNLKRRKGYALINILGLATGMAACLIIFMVVRYELSYNTSQPAYANIYRVNTEDKGPEGISYTPGVPYPALEALRIDFPQIKTGVLYAAFGAQVAVQSKAGTVQNKFMEGSGMFFCDPQFFDIFPATWLAGSPAVLGQPNSVVLSRSVANKYFGSWQHAIGRSIRLENAMDMKVGAILEDLPANTDFPITIAGSFITIKKNRYYGYTTDWGSITSNFQVFMLLPPSVSAAQVNRQLAGLANKYYNNDHYFSDGGVNKRSNLLQPLKAIHFDPDLPGFGDHVTSYPILITLSMIGFFIVVMACINFINLSTAQSVTRSKEVGIRKVLGSNRHQLFFQIMSETALIVLVSVIAALGLTWFSLPYIKYVASIQEELYLLTLPNSLFILITVATVTLFSGFYPALVLSGFQPVLALKNKFNLATVGGISLRRGLVITQFVISQALIIGTVVAVSQMNFIRTADLGFNKEAVLVLGSSSDSAVVARHEAFKESLLQLPGVKNVALCSDVPSSDSNSGTNFAYDHKPDENFTLYLKYGDADYFKTFDLKFAAGGPYQANDTSGQVVVNETLLRKLNIKNPQDAIGKDIRTGRNRWRSIAGVVKDFKTNSLRDAINPLMLASRKTRFSLVSVKLHATDLQSTQAAIQKLWDKHFPDYVYDASFMEENIARFYEQEEQLTLLYKIFATLAIFISCLGLYGLVSFMAVQRTKEVGIRKVLGAGIRSIVLLFSKEFTLLIMIAFVISAPLAWYFMNSWLENFANRVHIGWPVFTIALLASVMVAWLSVGYKAFMAAIANPVKSLRSE